MQDHYKVEVFDVYKEINIPAIYQELSSITVIDLVVAYHFIASKDPLEKFLAGYDIFGEEEAQELVQILDVESVSIQRSYVEPLNQVLGHPPKPSVEEAPKLELKNLPSHLRYAFSGNNETLLVILSVEISEVQFDAALEILKRIKKSIGGIFMTLMGLVWHCVYTKFIWKKVTKQVYNTSIDWIPWEGCGKKIGDQVAWRMHCISYLRQQMEKSTPVRAENGGMIVVTNDKNELTQQEQSLNAKFVWIITS